ncbi:MAG: hypothetical protein JW782_01200 [Candidatus Saganbacteria bacterium]|nr:hypothetical protein [Candidatus Saganbacteria bacterium]
MRALLVETTIRNSGQGARRYVPEPAHLLGMYHILAKKGHQVRLAAEPSARSLSSLVRDFSPHFVGFTSYRLHCNTPLSLPDHPCVDSLQEHAFLIQAMQRQGIKIGIGGRGATLNPGHFARAYRPDFIVKGLGEIPMMVLAGSGFDGRAIEHEDVYCGNIEDTAILQAPRGEKWIEVSFERPYSLENHASTARVYVQIGCFGRCIFCAEDHLVNYRPLEYVLDEL